MTDQPNATEDHDELARLKELATTHGKTVLTGVAVLLVLILGIRACRVHKRSQAEEASALFGSARSVDQLETLVDEYESAPSAPLAKLRLAKTYFDEGKFDEALTTYRAIKEEGSRLDPARDAAELGIAASLEAKGLVDEALQRYESFLATHSDHFLGPQAVLGKARCLQKLYRTSEAKTVMEDYIAANPESEWSAPAEELLERLNRHLEEARKDAP